MHAVIGLWQAMCMQCAIFDHWDEWPYKLYLIKINKKCPHVQIKTCILWCNTNVHQILLVSSFLRVLRRRLLWPRPARNHSFLMFTERSRSIPNAVECCIYLHTYTTMEMINDMDHTFSKKLVWNGSTVLCRRKKYWWKTNFYVLLPMLIQ